MGQHCQAVEQVSADHFHRVSHCGEVVGPVPFRQQGQEVQQLLLLLPAHADSELAHTLLQPLPAGRQIDCVTHQAERFFRWISSREIAAGVTPGIRLA